MKVNRNIEILLTTYRRRFKNEPLSLVEYFYKQLRLELIQSRKTYSKNVINANFERVEAMKLYLKERK